jgi:hypothetical protein
MLRWFRLRTRAPEAVFREASAWFDDFVQKAIRSGEAGARSFGPFVENKDLRVLFDYHLNDVCQNVFCNRSETVQMTTLRMHVLNDIDQLLTAEQYLALSDEDRRIVSDLVFTDRSKVDNDRRFTNEKLLYEAAVVVLHWLCNFFNDVKRGNWFNAYFPTARACTRTEMISVVSRSKGDADLFAILLPELQKRRGEIRETARSGGNYELTEDQLEQLR